MPNNKITDKEFVTGIAELMKIRAEQQPEKVKELRERYPEGSSDNLTKEQKISKIIDMLETLGVIAPDPTEALQKLLGRQPIPVKQLDTIRDYAKRRKAAAGYDECMLLIDLFNYGYIEGKRAERKRRREQGE